MLTWPYNDYETLNRESMVRAGFHFIYNKESDYMGYNKYNIKQWGFNTLLKLTPLKGHKLAWPNCPFILLFSPFPITPLASPKAPFKKPLITPFRPLIIISYKKYPPPKSPT